jgi:transcriptional activator SPT7
MFLFSPRPPLFWKPLITSRKEEGPEYPPPRPFLPLTNSTWQNQLPNLFHAFFNARQEAGQGFQDEGFDHSHSQIGSLGQIVIKAPPLPKKKVEVERKKKVAKVV